MFDFQLQHLNEISRGTLMEHMGIQYVYMDEHVLQATMSVDHRTFQPMKLLHGGAIMALAESVGSALSYIQDTKKMVLGIEINGTHMNATDSGIVIATAKFLKKGKTLHTIEVVIEDERKKVVSICRLTNYIR